MWCLGSSLHSCTTTVSVRLFQQCIGVRWAGGYQVVDEQTMWLGSYANLVVKGKLVIYRTVCNWTVYKSLSTGDVPLYLKSAYIIPRLKKPDLDDNEARNYRPISNITVLAKLLERLVAKQLIAYLKLHGLLPQLQSAYRAAYSTKKLKRRYSK